MNCLISLNHFFQWMRSFWHQIMTHACFTITQNTELSIPSIKLLVCQLLLYYICLKWGIAFKDPSVNRLLKTDPFIGIVFLFNTYKDFDKTERVSQCLHFVIKYTNMYYYYFFFFLGWSQIISCELWYERISSLNHSSCNYSGSVGGISGSIREAELPRWTETPNLI